MQFQWFSSPIKKSDKASRSFFSQLLAVNLEKWLHMKREKKKWFDWRSDVQRNEKFPESFQFDWLFRFKADNLWLLASANGVKIFNYFLATHVSHTASRRSRFRSLPEADQSLNELFIPFVRTSTTTVCSAVFNVNRWIKRLRDVLLEHFESWEKSNYFFLLLLWGNLIYSHSQFSCTSLLNLISLLFLWWWQRLQVFNCLGDSFRYCWRNEMNKLRENFELKDFLPGGGVGRKSPTGRYPFSSAV